MNPLLLVLALAATVVINMPFGYWRAYSSEHCRRLEWILAVHAPVAFIAPLRAAVGVSLSPQSLPLLVCFILAYFAGQRIGGILYSHARRRNARTTRCMFADMLGFSLKKPI